MTIDKAIETLTSLERTLPSILTSSGIDALKLGTNALIRIRYQRQKPTAPHKTLLQGETEKKKVLTK